jgi:ERCC4-type nuclease
VTPEMVVFMDTREQRPPPPPPGVTYERWTLSEGDYTTRALQGVGVIERKSAEDFAASIIGCERFDDEVRRLLNYRFKAVVVEGSLGEVYRCRSLHPHAVLGKICSLLARSDLPCLFVENAAGCGRTIAGLLRRWEERVAEEGTPQ